MLLIKPAGLCSVTETHIVGKNPLLKAVLSPTRVPFHTYTHRGTYMLIILYLFMPQLQSSKKHLPESGSQQWSLTSPLYRPLLLISRAGLTNSRHRGKARGPMRLDRSTAPIPASYPLLEYLNHRVRNSDSLQRSSG